MKHIVTVVVLVLIAAAGVHAVQQKKAQTYELSSFVSDYMKDWDVHAQQAVATEYLKHFTLAELNAELEKKYPLAECHTQGHGLGRAVYEQEKSFSASMQKCGESCNYGCFHGAMMEMFSTDSDTLGGAVDESDPQAYMQAIYSRGKKLCSSPEVQSVVLPAFCVHGVGHIFAVAAKYDLRTALGSCSVFHTPGGARSCADGVFMEYGFAHANAETIREKGFSICDPFPRYAENCYRHIAWLVIPTLGGVEPAIQKCQTLDSAYLKNSCIFGVAFAELRLKDFLTADGPDHVCGSLTDAAQKEACIRGGLIEVVNGTGDAQSNASCEAMDPLYQKECIRWLDNQRSFKTE